MLKCWTGCTVEEVVAALGMTMMSLWYDAGETDPKKLAAAKRERDREDAALAVERKRLRYCVDQARTWETVSSALFLRLIERMDDDKLAALCHEALETARTWNEHLNPPGAKQRHEVELYRPRLPLKRIPPVRREMMEYLK